MIPIVGTLLIKKKPRSSSSSSLRFPSLGPPQWIVFLRLNLLPVSSTPTQLSPRPLLPRPQLSPEVFLFSSCLATPSLTSFDLLDISGTAPQHLSKRLL